MDAKRTPPVARPDHAQRTEKGRPEVGRALTCALVGFDRLVHDAISGMLQLRAGLRVVAQASGVADGRQACLSVRPDVVILDFAGLGRPVLAIAKHLFAAHAGARAIVITSTDQEFRRPSWLPTDRYAIVGRADSFDLLLAALESLFEDRRAETDRLASDGARRRPRRLTDREAQIMALLGEGLTTREVAAILGRSPHTIQTHRKRIAEKVGRLGSRLARRMASHRQDGRDHNDGDNRRG